MTHENYHRPAGDGRVALVTGTVGPTVARGLLRAGYRVRALVRAQSARDSIPEGVACIEGDLSDRGALAEAAHGVDVVFHLAAKLHVNQPDASLRAEYRRVNVEGTRCVAEAAAEAGVKRFVHFSTINVYGSSVYPAAFDESSPPNCDGWYAKTKLESERIVLDRLPSTVLRLAAVYGPRMKGNYTRLADVLRKGRYVPIGSGRNRRTLVYQEDAAQAALLAATHPQALGQTYNVSDSEIHSLCDVVAAMCRALGRDVPVVSLPVAPARFCAAAVDAALRCLRRRPFALAAVNKILEDVAVDATRIRSQLGYVPQYDLNRGWRAALSRCPTDPVLEFADEACL